MAQLDPQVAAVLERVSKERFDSRAPFASAEEARAAG